jgi:hypothetical protein
MRKLVLFIFLFPLIATACINSSKQEARRYGERMPDRIGTYSQEDIIELTEEAVSDKGHMTLVYEASDGEVFVVIDVYGTEPAAEVAVERRVRDLRLMGLELETDRVARYSKFGRADIIEMPNGRLAMFNDKNVVIEVQFIKAEPDTDVSDDDWTAFLTAVREVGDSVE